MDLDLKLRLMWQILKVECESCLKSVHLLIKISLPFTIWKNTRDNQIRAIAMMLFFLLVTANHSYE